MPWLYWLRTLLGSLLLGDAQDPGTAIDPEIFLQMQEPQLHRGVVDRSVWSRYKVEVSKKSGAFKMDAKYYQIT